MNKLRRMPVEVTLIDRRNFHLFQPLVYQVATGALSPGEIAAPLRSVFKRARNVRVLLGEVGDVDLERRVVIGAAADRGPAGARGPLRHADRGGRLEVLLLRQPAVGRVRAGDQVARERARRALPDPAGVRGRRARDRPRAARRVADVRGGGRRPDRRRDGGPDLRARARHAAARLPRDGPRRGPDPARRGRRPRARRLPARPVGERGPAARQPRRDLARERAGRRHRRRRRRAQGARRHDAARRRAHRRVGGGRRRREHRRAPGGGRRGGDRPRGARDRRAGPHARGPSRGDRARRHGARARAGRGHPGPPGRRPGGDAAGPLRRGGREAPARRQAGQAVPLHRQGQPRHDRPRPRRRRDQGAALRRPARLAAVARDPHLLPDRIPEPDPRADALVVLVPDPRARRAAAHGGPDAPGRGWG